MYDDMSKLSMALDRAEYVKVLEGASLIIVWHGGLTFNIYDETFKAVDCFTVQERPKLLSEVEKIINSWVNGREL